MFSHHASARLLLCGATLLVLCLSAGCKKDDNNPTNSSNPRFFSVAFSKYESNNHPTWVILHSLDGSSVVSVKPVPETGIVDFGILDTDRVSFTIAQEFVHGRSGDLWSYMNVPAGHWNDPYFYYNPYSNHRQDSIGTAEFTIAYPLGNYEIISVSLPGYNLESHSILGDDSTLSWQTNLFNTEDHNNISIYAYVQSSASYYCGWLVNQPFAMNQTNTYSLRLDQSVQTKTISCSRPVDRILVFAMRGSAGTSYLMYGRGFGGMDSADFTVAYSDFPADRIQLQLSGESEGSGFTFDYFGNVIPSTLAIPTGEVNAAYNPSEATFENIAISGEADMLELTWVSYDESSYNYWNVCVDPAIQSPHLPAVPDSILTSLNFDMSSVTGNSAYIEDFDTYHGFDDYVSQEFKSTTPRWQRYNSKYGIFTFPDQSIATQRTSGNQRLNSLGHRTVENVSSIVR